MKCNMIQKESGLSVSFDILSSGKVIATAFLKDNLSFGGSWEYYEHEFLKYKLIFCPYVQMKNLFKSTEDKIFISYDIKNSNDEIIGSVCQKQIRNGLFSSYEYFELILNEKTYKLYVVGMGKEGNKFPIYYEEKQIALIEKDCVVHNNLDVYFISALDEIANEISCIFSLYVDALMFGHRGEIMIKSVSKTYNLTTNKVLKSKYDPSFIKNNRL